MAPHVGHLGQTLGPRNGRLGSWFCSFWCRTIFWLLKTRYPTPMSALLPIQDEHGSPCWGSWQGGASHDPPGSFVFVFGVFPLSKVSFLHDQHGLVEEPGFRICFWCTNLSYCVFFGPKFHKSYLYSSFSCQHFFLEPFTVQQWFIPKGGHLCSMRGFCFWVPNRQGQFQPDTHKDTDTHGSMNATCCIEITKRQQPVGLITGPVVMGGNGIRRSTCNFLHSFRQW